MSARAMPLSLAAVSIAFAGLWALLFSCDLFRIEPPGLQLEPGDAGRLVVRTVDAGSPAEAAGLRTGDELRAVDGWPIATRLDAIAADANLRAGEPRRLVVVRHGVEMPTAIAVGDASWRHSLTADGLAVLFARAVQLATLAIAVLIAFKRPRDPAALGAAWMLATVAVTSVTLPYRFASAWRALPAPLSAAIAVPFLSRSAIGAAIFVFFALFPRRGPSRRAIALALVPIAAVTVWHASFAWRLFAGRPGPEPIEPALPLVVATNVAYAAAGLALAARRYRRMTDVTDRRRMRVLLGGAVVASLSGSTVFLYYWASERAQIGHPAMTGLPATVGTLLFLAMPLAFAHAILRHRLFDVSVILRRGLQYALARQGLALLVPALVGSLTLDLLWNGSAGMADAARRHGWIYLVVGGAAIVARVRRDRWLNALDKRFFRERYSAHRLLREITSDLRQHTGRDLAAVLPRVVARIHAALHPETAIVLARTAGDGTFEPLDATGATPLRLGGESRIVSMAALLQKPIETPASDTAALARELPADERDALRDARVELIVPIVRAGGSLETLLALGPKRSEEPYSAEDLDLLAAIADGLALAIDRAGVRAPAAFSGDAMLRCLSGRYRLERVIGEGGMGTVYAATDLALEREVAVKLVRDDLAARPDTLERFRHETQILASFTHPNIVTVHDYGIAPGGRAFIVMEMLRGETLAERLAREGALAPAAALRILREAGEAVETAHGRGLVHRDLKPANVFLARDDAGERAKVLDFGIARLALSPGAATWTGTIAGTPRYMAPEQLRGEDPSTRWDVWALTMIAVEMLAGRRPFDSAGAGGPEDLTAIPAAWRPFFDAALAFDPSRRPATVAALVEAVARLVEAARPVSCADDMRTP